MPLTLDETLAAVQNNVSRKPIIEIVSKSIGEAIPLIGKDLTALDDYEKPHTIIYSAGNVLVVYTDNAGRNINYIYSDVNRTEFSSQVVFGPFTGDAEAELVEREDSSIAILLRYYSDPNYIFMYYIIDVSGSILYSGTAFQNTDWTSSHYVIKLSDDTFALVYSKNVSDVYNIYLRTSSDCITWSSESVITPSGLEEANAIRSPSLMEEEDGTIWLWFAYVDSGSDDNEVVNIYYSVATAIDQSFSAATKFTDYTSAGMLGDNPKSYQINSTTMNMVFNLQMNSLYIDTSDPLWPVSTFQDDNVTDGHYDPETGKLYVINSYDGGGGSYLHSIVEIDVATWGITDYWDEFTSPALNELYFVSSSTGWNNKFGAGKWIPVLSRTSNCFAIINTLTETIAQYNFWDNATYSLTKNISHPYVSGFTIVSMFIDEANARVYVALTNPSIYNRWMLIGYISLVDVGPEYTWFSLVTESAVQGEGELRSLNSNGEFGFDEIADLIWTCSKSYIPQVTGHIRIWIKSTGDLYKYYTRSTTGFPYLGVNHVCYYNGKIYCSFPYSDYNMLEREKRGLCEINLGNDIIKFHRPTHATKDEYDIKKITAYIDDKLLVATVDGLLIFDTATETWEIYNNTSVPGLFPESNNQVDTLLGFDEDTGQIYVAPYIGGVLNINPGNIFNTIYYSIGTKTGSWGFSESTELVSGTSDSDANVSLEPTTNAMYVFWTNLDTSDDSTKVRWDKEQASYDLTQHLTNDEISISRSIDGALNTLKFNVSLGHLFDPYNSTSLLSIFLVKGRKITVRIGEEISGIDYLQNQGSFIINEASISYVKGSAPKMMVTAQDKRIFWDVNKIVATESYSATPENIFLDLITEFGDMEAGEIDVPEIPTSFTIVHQWVDSDLKSIVNDLSNRFGYFSRIDEDDNFTIRPISNDNDTDNTYTDLSTCIEFSPTYEFSDFINSVVVSGEEQDFTEIILEEERLSVLSGTVGWWGFKKDFYIYYSEDKSKRAKYPRLEVLETATSIAFQLAGGIDEEISFVDTVENQYCIVTITAPNLIPMLIAAIGGYLMATRIPDGLSIWSDSTISIGRTVEGISLQLALMILGSIGNFQYEIWGSPVGYVRRSVQADANDMEMQRLIGRTVIDQIEGFLTHTVAQCQEVADFELLITKLQRRRVKFKKVTNLQDQEGDTIVIPHPYTGLPLRIFITDLNRKYKKPGIKGNDGYILDDCEGWVLL